MSGTGRPGPAAGTPRARRAAEVLERRYRRLLGWYPASFRAAYAEEMLGVAMARSEPGRRRPGLGETADLIVSGIHTRLGSARAWIREPAWHDAAAALSVIGPILMAGASARTIGAGRFAPSAMLPLASGVSRTAVALTAGWALAAVAAMLGRRRMAAAGAVLVATAQIATLGLSYSNSPSEFVSSWWKLVFAVVIALAALVAVGSERRPVSWPAATAIAAAAALLGAWPAIEEASVTITPFPGGGGIASTPFSGVQGIVTDGLLALVVLVLLVVVGRLSRAVRRRVVILLLPVASGLALVSWTFGGFLASSPRFLHPVLMTPPQWAALVLVPVAAFCGGLIWLNRHERFLSTERGTAAGRTG